MIVIGRYAEESEFPDDEGEESVGGNSHVLSGIEVAHGRYDQLYEQEIGDLVARVAQVVHGNRERYRAMALRSNRSLFDSCAEVRAVARGVGSDPPVQVGARGMLTLELSEIASAEAPCDAHALNTHYRGELRRRVTEVLARMLT